LIRAIFAGTSLETEFRGIGLLGEALLEPHRCYLDELARLQAAGVAVQALAHITGGGLVENLPRVLTEGLTVRLEPGSWPAHPLFQLIQAEGEVSDEEMRRVFNLGIGMVAVIEEEMAETALEAIDGEGWLIGEVIEGQEIKWE
jgi:phosphoribosylformylglycinamidine cyclo-ligase